MLIVDKNNFLIDDADSNRVGRIKNKIDKFSTNPNICDFIILHYTASTTASSAHNNFLNPATQVSWHLTVDRDGTIHQLYDFRKITWHAGHSGWKTARKTYTSMNPVSIGIEMINAGPLSKQPDGTFKTWSGQTVDQQDVFVDKKGKFWHSYTDIQIKTVAEICEVLMIKYKCIDILGHEEISPGRKQDPGPAFADALRNIRGH